MSQLRPDDAQTYFDYGLAFLELGPGLEKQAVEAFESAVRLRPAWAQAHTQLGYAYASAGRRDDAIAEYGRALKLSPGDVDTWGALAHAAFLSDRYQEAEHAGVRLEEVCVLPARVSDLPPLSVEPQVLVYRLLHVLRQRPDLLPAPFYLASQRPAAVAPLHRGCPQRAHKTFC